MEISITMPTTTIVYIGRCNERDYVFALDRGVAEKLVRQHFAFGNPSCDDYAVSNKWALSDTAPGWKIITQEVDTLKIEVELKVGDEDETSHVAWTCPVCTKAFSDDWTSGDRLPILLSCGCNDKSKFLLGVRNM
jgi:hypothetical protein